MTEFDTTGQNQGNSAPVGTDPAGSTSAQPAEPSILDIADDNQLVRIKGSEKPVKFGDYSRGFQAQATRATQERAKFERELAAERSTRERLENEARQRSQGQGQGNQPDVLDQLRQLPYLDGATAAQVISSIGTQFQNRDRIILGLAQELQKVQRLVGGLNETHTQSNFNTKIDRFLTDGGYGPELRNLAVETYLAYEPGADLDAEFPRILAERVEEVGKYFEAKRQASLASARKQPFVPGRGGQAGPTKPLTIRPDASAKEIADLMWPGGFGGEGT